MMHVHIFSNLHFGSLESYVKCILHICLMYIKGEFKLLMWLCCIDCSIKAKVAPALAEGHFEVFSVL